MANLPERKAGGRRLVVGASRGIGLALVEAQLDDPGVDNVIATHRDGSNLAALSDIRERHGDRLTLHRLDVADRQSFADFADFLAGSGAGIDLAIHAAGILHDGSLQPEKSVSQCEPDNLKRMFEINSIAPLMTARTLLPLQSRNQRFTFAALSAMVGSIGDNRLGGWYGYRASKAALNQFIRTLANECRFSHPRAAIVAVHPGTTDTHLSRPFQRNVDAKRLYTPKQTASRILAVIDGIGSDGSGRFYNWDGSEIPW
jgi:NAD(P)-dependent dehydrogenase (short-subunit alcohol dehydrogenase family)